MILGALEKKLSSKLMSTGLALRHFTLGNGSNHEEIIFPGSGDCDWVIQHPDGSVSKGTTTFSHHCPTSLSEADVRLLFLLRTLYIEVDKEDRE